MAAFRADHQDLTVEFAASCHNALWANNDVVPCALEVLQLSRSNKEILTAVATFITTTQSRICQIGSINWRLCKGPNNIGDSCSNISRTVWPRITKFNKDIDRGIRTGNSKTALNTLELLTQRQQTKTNLIENAKGKILTEDKEIHKRWTEYYKELYDYKLKTDANILKAKTTWKTEKQKTHYAQSGSRESRTDAERRQITRCWKHPSRYSTTRRTMHHGCLHRRYVRKSGPVDNGLKTGQSHWLFLFRRKTTRDFVTTTNDVRQFNRS